MIAINSPDTKNSVSGNRNRRDLYRMPTVFDSGNPERSRSRETVRVIVAIDDGLVDVWETREDRIDRSERFEIGKTERS